MGPKEAQAKLSFWRQRTLFYDQIAQANGGLLSLSDAWRRNYCLSPYLSLASCEYIDERFIAHYHNLMMLDEQGRVVPRTNFTDSILAPLSAHLWEEYEARGGAPALAVVERAAEEIRKYYKNGRPKGAALFANHPASLGNVIVKFGKRGHLVNMLEKGEVRLSPASHYAKGSLLKAMRDLEAEREFHIPAFTEVLKGRATVDYKGAIGKVADGFIKVIIECPNYILWSACVDVDRRLPDDFDADAALIVRQPEQFTQRFLRAARTVWGDIGSWHGPVKYYDPCSRTHMKVRPETIKHFLFAYQREWRLCLFPPANMIPKEPVNLDIGSLRDIAELVMLPT